jgi:NAD(P)-dependent dehydrogenase (short-subunit alcohol dehydrogenase family)
MDPSRDGQGKRRVMDIPIVARHRGDSTESDAEYIDRVVGVLTRIGKPAEIAQTIAWLYSESPSYVTRHTLAADDGYKVH